MKTLFATFALTALSSCSGDQHASEQAIHETQNKREYSIIESEYYSRENDKIEGVHILNSKFDSSYQIALIKMQKSEYNFTVLMLNPKNPPYLKSFPIERFHVTNEIDSALKTKESWSKIKKELR